MRKKLVAYFSPTGTTAKLAKTLAEAAGADLFEIKPETPYTRGDLNWMDKNARSTVEMNDPASRPAIAAQYVAPTIINSFLESYDLTGKTVVTFATSGGSGMGKTLSRLEPSCKGAKLVEGKVFRASTSAVELRSWVEGLGV